VSVLTFIWGALTMSCAVAALCFARFYVRTRERLFVWFATAFAVLGLNWMGLALSPAHAETHNAVYLIRLLAFVIIIAAMIDQNRQKK
jgi:hypothetical protein